MSRLSSTGQQARCRPLRRASDRFGHVAIARLAHVQNEVLPRAMTVVGHGRRRVGLRWQHRSWM